MEDLNKAFKKKFGGLVIISKTKSYTEEDMKKFIRQREKDLLTRLEQIVGESGCEKHKIAARIEGIEGTCKMCTAIVSLLNSGLDILREELSNE